jgi:hypothetical protein
VVADLFETKVFLEQRYETVGQHRHPVLRPLAVADDECLPIKFEILDTQARHSIRRMPLP